MHRLTRIGTMALCLGIFALASREGQAALVNLGPGSFTPLASTITFSEFPVSTPNPVYSFTGLTGLGNETVSFGGTFVGQTTTSNGTVTTLANHLPTGPLALNPAGTGPATFIANDGAMPTSPVLSGTPIYNGPISVFFSAPVAGVGLTGGFFNALNSTSIEAYGVNGASLGILANTQLGNQFFGLADSTGANVIKGISFYVTGNEPFGFDIDNLTFGAAVTINVPEPSSLLLLGLGAVGLLGLGRRKLKSA